MVGSGEGGREAIAPEFSMRTGCVAAITKGSLAVILSLARQPWITKGIARDLTRNHSGIRRRLAQKDGLHD
jgi:hypothetical protein